MTDLKTPIITTVIGEGGSGGALAIAVADSVLMLQYATYAVISPEGCASILWKSAERASEAAETMGITAARLKSFGLIDRIVTEPVGGAHRDPRAIAVTLKKTLQDVLKQLSALSTSELIERRFERLMSYGKFKEQALA
jgi:acetyl-CoA carboxylase carboxyl transferase subunit alpha